MLGLPLLSHAPSCSKSKVRRCFLFLQVAFFGGVVGWGVGEGWVERSTSRTTGAILAPKKKHPSARKVVDEFAVGEDEDISKKTMLSVNWVISEAG